MIFPILFKRYQLHSLKPRFEFPGLFRKQVTGKDLLGFRVRTEKFPTPEEIEDALTWVI